MYHLTELLRIRNPGAFGSRFWLRVSPMVTMKPSAGTAVLSRPDCSWRSASMLARVVVGRPPFLTDFYPYTSSPHGLLA